MAIKLTKTTAQGFVAEDAYHRVEKVCISKKDLIVFKLREYKNEESTLPFAENVYECHYDINGKNPIAQAYEFIKTLPLFSDAVDC